MRSVLAVRAAVALAACADETRSPVEARAPGAHRPVTDIYWGPQETIFTTQTPASTLSATPGWEVATEFTAEDTLLIVGFRFYKAVGETGSHTARLFTSGGVQIASRGFTGESASGWQSTNLASAVQIPPGDYVVSVNTNEYQVKTFAYFGTINRTKLTADGGRYGQPTGSFPSSASGSAFFEDVKFKPKLCNDDVDFPCP